MFSFWITLFGISSVLWVVDGVIVDFQNITQGNNEFITSSNDTSARQAGFGFVKFETEPDVDHDQYKYGFIQFENNHSDGDNYEDSPSGPPFEYGLKRPVKFEDSPSGPNNNVVDVGEPIRFEGNDDVANAPNGVAFQDDNSLEQKPVQKKKRRRRRRKPRQQRYPAGLPTQAQNSGLQYPAQNSAGLNPQFGIYQGYGYPQGVANGYGYSGYPQGQYRPPRRVRVPQQQDALSAITSALASVARHDDLQCVPRLLCEAAGGAGAAGAGAAAGVLAPLQPLLTLLSAYNLVSSSPLFVFGRAVFLGMTSSGNSATCRYAYSSCPTDPEQLVHYLNNHNGGFFRFFNSPQRPGQQNLQQFYNHLSGAYGQQGVNGQTDNGQNYGYYEPNQGQYGGIQNQYQNYGLYQQNGASYNNYAPNYNSNPQQQQQYGFAQNIYRNDVDKEIQNRIQNKPSTGLVDDYDDGIHKYKLIFSENTNNQGDNQPDDIFKFPEQTSDQPDNFDIRDSKVFKFPHKQDNRQYAYRPQQPVVLPNNDYYNKFNTNQYNNYAVNKYPNNNYASTNYANNNYATNKVNNYASNNYASNNYAGNNNAGNNYATNKVNNYASNNYAGNSNAGNNYVSNKYASNNYASNNYAGNNYARPVNNNQGVTTVYVIRGNGDPNKPEIINLRPGESLT